MIPIAIFASLVLLGRGPQTVVCSFIAFAVSSFGVVPISIVGSQVLGSCGALVGGADLRATSGRIFSAGGTHRADTRAWDSPAYTANSRPPTLAPHTEGRPPTPQLAKCACV
eukprot:401071-Prymnesium_polylepis.1